MRNRKKNNGFLSFKKNQQISAISCGPKNREVNTATGLILAVCLLPLPLPILAQSVNTLAASAPSVSTRSAQDENWLVTQVRKFRAYPHLHHAYQLQKTKHLKEAATEMQAYLALEPSDLTVQQNYLELLMELKDNQGMLRYTAQLLAASPNNPRAILYQGLALHALGNDTLAADRFMKAYGNVLAGAAPRIVAANLAANIHLAKDQYQQALLDLAVLASLQNDYNLHYRRGLAQRALGKLDDARLAFLQALAQAKTRRDKVETLSALGYLAQKKNNTNETIQYGEAILANDFVNVEWLHVLTEIYLKNKNYSVAESLARRSLGITNSLSDRIYLANILSDKKDYAAAIEQYEVVAREAKDPKEALHARMGIGYSYQALGNRTAAHNAFALAARAFPSREALVAVANTEVETRGASSNVAQQPADLTGLLASYQQKPSAEVAASIGYLYAEKKELTSAARYLEAALQLKSVPEWRLSLAELYAELSAKSKADETLSTFTAKNAAQWRRVADVYGRIGNNTLAANAMAHIASNAEDYLQLSEYYVQLHRPEQALEQLRIALTQQASATQRQQAWRETAYLQLDRGNDDLAMAAFLAAIDNGDKTIALHTDLGYLYEKKHVYPAALAQFQQALAAEKTAPNMINVARMHAATKHTAQAINWYEAARATSGLDQKTMTDITIELGSLYASIEQFDRAEQVWQSAAAGQPTPEIQLQLAYALEMRGKLMQSLAMLTAMRASSLDQTLRLRMLEQTARVAEKAGQLDVAANALEQANAVMPSAERQFEMALLSAKQKQTSTARLHIENAIRLDPNKLDYIQQLGYICKDQGDTRCAVRAFEQVLDRDPQRVALYQDMAYTYTQAGQNDKAIAWFKKAIDEKTGNPISRSLRTYFVEPLPQQTDLAQPQDTAETNQNGDSLNTPQLTQATPLVDSTSDAQQVYAMREQVSDLSQRYQLNGYQSYRGGKSKRPNGNAAPGQFTSGSLLPSQGGLEFVFQPPEIGYQDGKTFRLIARTLWANRPESFSVDSKTVQGGVGLEYKPFKDVDAYVSIDRQIKIGSQSENNWLVRGSWGYSDGYGLKPNQRSWNQTLLYIDLGVALQHEKTRSASAEVRQGQTFNYNNNTLVTPHVLASFRKQWPDPSNTSRNDIGAGVAVKYLFNETLYETARSSAEITLQYRKQIGNQREGGWVITGSFRY